MSEGDAVTAVAEELVALLGSGRQVEPFSRRYEGFDLAAAYGVVEAVRARREAAGARPLWRKIGFTNKNMWETYRIAAPIWNYVYDRTLVEADVEAGAAGKEAAGGRVDLAGLSEPLVEPEVAFHLCAAPRAEMSATALLNCIDWVAPAFEVVFSVFPKWDMAAADAAAAFGMHGALLLGQRLDARANKSALLAALADFTVTLESDDGTRRSGAGANVLGSPLAALQQLLADLARNPDSPALEEGEIVTTGSLTDPMPARPGAEWTASFQGIGLKPLRLHLD